MPNAAGKMHSQRDRKRSHHSSSSRPYQRNDANKKRQRDPSWYQDKGYTDQETVPLQESSVGIYGFLTDAEGFLGNYKERYSDFIVHEIDAAHRLITLNALLKRSQSLAKTFQELVLSFLSTDSQHAQSDVKVVKMLNKKLSDVTQNRMQQEQKALEAYNHRTLVHMVTKELGNAQGEEFETFLNRVKAQNKLQNAQREQKTDVIISKFDNIAPKEDDLVFYVSGLTEKKDRVQLHESIRRFGKKLIVAETITTAKNGKVIRVSRARVDATGKLQDEKRRDWPVNLPDYLQFVLYKQNKDTLSVISQIAGQLHIPVSTFAYAETKEKRGITTQSCTAYRLRQERFQQLARSTERPLHEHPFIVGNVRYVSSKLVKESIWGNQFTIVIRSLSDVNACLSMDECVLKWTQAGFINFFGTHRFGSSRLLYSSIGRAILRKDFRQAIMMLLKPQEGEATKIRQAREHYRQHKDMSAALRMFPPFLVAERAVLEGLIKHGSEAYELAFQNVPQNLRVMYVESYQSYVWNQMASKRVAQDPVKAIIGDLVLQCPKSGTSVSGNVQSDDAARVFCLTEDNVSQYTLKDVVLPVPGFDVEYPKNDIGSAFKALLAKDGVYMNTWKPNAGVKCCYTLDGTYRLAVETPRKTVHKVVKYANATQSLVSTDVDHLTRKSGVDHPTSKQDAPEADKHALILEFALPADCDAIVALRELMKQKCEILTSSGKEWTKKSEAGEESTEKDKSSQSKPGKKAVSIGRPGFSLGRF